MRRLLIRDHVVHVALAAVLLLPLAFAFTGPGSADEVFGDSAARVELFQVLARSSWIGLGATAVALLLGLPAGWALARRPRASWWGAWCALPLALAPSVAVSGWLHWFAPGYVKSSFGQALAEGPTWSPIFSAPGVALVLGLGFWPIVAFETWPAFRRARGEGYEAALLAGSPLRAFFHVALPMARGEWVAGALLVFMLATGDFTVSSLLLVRTLPIHVHDFLAQGRNGAAAWAALPLAALIAVTARVLLRVQRTAAEVHGEATADHTKTCSSSSRWADGMLLTGIVLGFVLPLGGCLDGVLRGGQSIRAAFAEGWDALFVSVRLAAAAAIAVVVLSALRVVFWPEMRARSLHAASLLLLLIPGPFLAAGLLLQSVQAADLFDHMGRAGSWLQNAAPAGLLLCAGYVLRFLYLPLRLTDEALKALDPALLEAAELAGHTRMARGLGIALPQVWGSLLVAAALVFVLTLGELPVAVKLAPPGVLPASVWLFSQQHLGYTESVFGLSLALGGVAVAVLAGTTALLLRWRRASELRLG